MYSDYRRCKRRKPQLLITECHFFLEWIVQISNWKDCHFKMFIETTFPLKRLFTSMVLFYKDCVKTDTNLVKRTAKDPETIYHQCKTQAPEKIDTFSIAYLCLQFEYLLNTLHFFFQAKHQGTTFNLPK